MAYQDRTYGLSCPPFVTGVNDGGGRDGINKAEGCAFGLSYNHTKSKGRNKTSFVIFVMMTSTSEELQNALELQFSR